jgi:hypothetical protein
MPSLLIKAVHNPVDKENVNLDFGDSLLDVGGFFA